MFDFLCKTRDAYKLLCYILFAYTQFLQHEKIIEIFQLQ